MLELFNIKKRLGDFLLEIPSYCLEEGEYFVFAGPSGAGKSQLLELIAGLSFPDEGKIIFDGIDITSLPTQKRKIGMVFQDMALFPHLTVKQNISFPMRAKKKEPIYVKNEIMKLAHAMSIEKLLDHYPHQLSGGEARRVALARTLASQPRLLLLDEPLSEVDTSLKVALRRLLRTINQQGVTIIHVSHDYEDALTLASKMAIINDGKIIQVGQPSEIFLKPASPFVAQFAGIRNFFHCKFRSLHNSSLSLAVINDEKQIFITGTISSTHGSIIIPARDIVLSEQKLESSARNNFPGIVKEIIPTREGLEVIVDCSFPLAAIVSIASVIQLKLEVGSKVWVSFKASSVQFLEG